MSSTRSVRTWVRHVRPARTGSPWSSIARPVACGVMPRVLAKVETWRQEGPTAFAKCHREGVVISDNGRVRLGHALAPLGSLAAERVWDLAQTRDGVLYAATGDAGKVFRREPKADAPWTRRLRFQRYAGSVTGRSLPDGTVYAGTGPNGNVVNLSDPKHPASSPQPEGPVHLGSGGRRARQPVCGDRSRRPALEAVGRRQCGRCIYDSKATHLLCLAIGPDGSVYAGGDGEGLIYRVSPDGKATILFDAPQAEVRALLWAGDGALYAGTAAEAGGGSTSRGSLFLTQGGDVPRFLDGPGPIAAGTSQPGRD